MDHATEWKGSYQGVAARTAVAGYFLRCMRLVEAGMLEDARRCCRRGRWREGLELAEIPAQVVATTDQLCERIETALEDGGWRSTVAYTLLLEVLDAWS